jgi:sugar lactone lactonase YvrE
MGQPRILVDGFLFPESPRWDGAHIWVSDMHAHRVAAFTEAGTKVRDYALTDKASGIGFLAGAGGGPIVVGMRSKSLTRLHPDGSTSVFADLTAVPGVDLNDMVVDGRGRIFVGGRFVRSFSKKLFEPSAEPSGETIVGVHRSGTWRVLATDLELPNGMAVTPDLQTLIVAETRAKRLLAFRITAVGDLVDRRVFAELTGNPDGICLDAEGAVWVGLPFIATFQRVLDGGRVVDEIKLGGDKWAIAPALGGHDGRTLFLTTAITTSEIMSACVDFASDERSGSRGFLEAIRVDVPQAGWP